ncbi:MAG: inorganic diphosphatase [Alphaproteobacteria bacterium]|nr:inorganic diphosphatase [Alphaproteobacteria bacterium]
MREDEAVPARVTARIEVPRGSFIKQELHGDAPRVDFISPVPCPFNYGYVPALAGADGDPLDAVVLGPRLAVGAEVQRPVVAVVRFWDAGQVDDKLVLSEAPLSPAEATALRAFFRLYGFARRWLNRLRGARGPTGYAGLSVVD